MSGRKMKGKLGKLMKKQENRKRIEEKRKTEEEKNRGKV